MKLNNKRTLLVGFAFFLICVFWQAYDAIIPLMLTNKFGLDQTWSGLIMSLDNILALFMLPIFGSLSDKANTKYGKRTPFIVIGTILAIVCFVGLSFVDAAQLQKIKDENVTNATYWQQKDEYVLSNREYHSITNPNVPQKYTLADYTAHVRYNKGYANLTEQEKADLQTWYEGIDFDYVYSFDTETDTYTTYDSKDLVPEGVRTTNTYSTVVSGAESLFAKGITQGNIFVLVLFIIVLLMTLISMATFRSPAVALMPDVTVKPLRSKANAIINLMGTAGGILVLLLGMVFGTGKVQNQLMDYRWFVATVCGIMLVALTTFVLTVKEKKWNQEMLDEQAKLDANEPQPEQQTEQPATSEKLSKDKLTSLIFILASVAMWFTGYNAITSKYSVYAVNVLNKDYNTTLLIAQAAAVVAYIPVGMVASKLGRKKTIMIGVGLLFAAFFGAIFVTASSPDFLITILFALAGIAWATINVNSFPMVVELAQGSTIGKYTGYYYTASMAAQVITPILSGWLMDTFGTMSILFPYATIFVGIAFVTMCFVKHGDSKPEQPKDKMTMLAGADD